MNIIEVGDEITTHAGNKVQVNRVESGKHGLLVEGVFRGYEDQWYGSYHPHELPPCEVSYQWYGWIMRASTTLPNGAQIGCLSWGVPIFKPSAGSRTIEDLDLEWERTLETMRLEQMSGTHTPDNTLQSRPFTEQSRPDVL